MEIESADRGIDSTETGIIGNDNGNGGGNTSGNAEPVAKRKRGRPRKNPQEIPIAVDGDLSVVENPSKPSRKRGEKGFSPTELASIIAGAMNVLAGFRGNHWCATEESVAPLAVPLSDALKRLPKKTVDRLTGIALPISIIYGALAVLAIPLLTEYNAWKDRQKNVTKPVAPNPTTKQQTTKPQSESASVKTSTTADNGNGYNQGIPATFGLD